MTARRPATIDVVILTWNDGPLLETAVASALTSEDVDVRVWVIDNASEPPAAVRDDPRVVLVRNPENRGVAPGRNQGAKLGGAPFLAFLDSDAQLLPETLWNLLVPMLDDTSVGVTVPVFVGQEPTASAGRAPSLWLKLQRALNRRSDYEALCPPGSGVWEVDFGIGACQLIRRVAFDQVGGLDEAIRFGPEDVDFCLRVKERGWRVLQVADARCVHPARRRFRGLLTRKGLRHGWTVARFYWRHRSRIR
ncbi:MAG: glycosyltransferase family 2 protein [Acidimicrobiales bacterium]